MSTCTVEVSNDNIYLMEWIMNPRNTFDIRSPDIVYIKKKVRDQKIIVGENGHDDSSAKTRMFMFP